MTAGQYEATVVIPTYCRVEALARVLGGLARQDSSPDEYEVVAVVDGGSGQVCRLLGMNDYTNSENGRQRYTVIPEGGPAASRNAGAALARGKVLIFLDDDIIPSPGLVREHLHLHRRETGVVGLGCIDLDSARTLEPFERYLYGFYEMHYQKMACPDHTPTFWDALTGNLSIPTRTFQAVGGFDTAFSLLRHEDIELAYRLHKAGARFHYLPLAKGYHQYVKTFARGCHEAYVNGISSVMLACRYPELHDTLIRGRWAALPLPARLVTPALCAASGSQLAARLEAIRPAVERIRSAAHLFYRVAYHLSFWRGVRDALNGASPSC